MKKTTAVSAWAMSGVFDLYFAFSIEDFRFSKQKVFYNSMGLEKILKSYFISKRSSEYKSLNFDASKTKIEEIAKNYGHKYKLMIRELKKDSTLNPDLKAILSKSYMSVEHISFNGNKFLKALEKIYQESRYPSATPISRSFIINKFFEIDPINSSALVDFIYDISILILKNLKKDINFLPKVNRIENYHSGIDSWIRFKRIFFTETDGDIVIFFS